MSSMAVGGGELLFEDISSVKDRGRDTWDLFQVLLKLISCLGD